MKADEIQHRRELFRIKREETLAKVLLGARERLGSSESFTRIPSKFIVPFVEKASLEEQHDDLMNMWSELLSSAATEYDPVHLRIIEILAQIGSAEANLKVLWKSSRSKRELHLVVEAPYFFASQFLRIHAENCFKWHKAGGPEKLLQSLIDEIEQPGGILNFVYLLGFNKKNYECEYYHPKYVSEENPVLSTLENLGLILIQRDIHFEKGERTVMLRTISLTEYGLILLKNCDREMKECLASAVARGAILESEA